MQTHKDMELDELTMTRTFTAESLYIQVS